MIKIFNNKDAGWIWIPTIESWKNDFRNYDGYIHYIVIIRWLNYSIGIDYGNR